MIVGDRGALSKQTRWSIFLTSCSMRTSYGDGSKCHRRGLAACNLAHWPSSLQSRGLAIRPRHPSFGVVACRRPQISPLEQGARRPSGARGGIRNFHLLLCQDMSFTLDRAVKLKYFVAGARRGDTPR